MQAFADSIQVKPTAWAYKELGFTLKAAGQPLQALDAFESARRLKSDPLTAELIAELSAEISAEAPPASSGVVAKGHVGTTVRGHEASPRGPNAAGANDTLGSQSWETHSGVLELTESGLTYHGWDPMPHVRPDETTTRLPWTEIVETGTSRVDDYTSIIPFKKVHRVDVWVRGAGRAFGFWCKSEQQAEEIAEAISRFASRSGSRGM
jgi:hypothetical protein